MSPSRPVVVVLAPIVPAQSGNGLAMRIRLLLEAVREKFDVWLIVQPLAGILEEPFASWWRGPAGVGDERTVRYDEIPLSTEAARADVMALIALPQWRDRLGALQRAAPVRFAPPALGAGIIRDAAQTVGQHRVVGVVACRLAMTPLGLALAEEMGVPLVVDADDDDVVYFTERGEHEVAEAWDAVARACLPEASLVTVASEPVRRGMDQEYGLRTRVRTVPNAVSLPGGAAASPGHGKLLFVGNLTYGPNMEGLAWFVRDVMPLLPPDLSLDVVGSVVTELAAESVGVRWHGRVPEVGPSYAATDAVIAPVFTGSGTRIKVLEAFAHVRPVIATRKAVEGIGAVDGIHVRVADSAPEFASACVAACDPVQGSRMARQALELVRDHYDFAVVAPAASELIAGCLAQGRKPPPVG